MTDQTIVSETTNGTSSLSSDLNRAANLALLFASVTGLADDAALSAVQLDRNASTHESVAEVLQVSEGDVVDVILTLHRDLLQRTQALEPELREVLYESRWDLYSE